MMNETIDISLEGPTLTDERRDITKNSQNEKSRKNHSLINKCVLYGLHHQYKEFFDTA
jgi:hypothetical protein